jgi:hypothetical protein
MGELTEADLRRAAAELGLEEEPDGLPDTAQAWGVAIDSGLVELEVDESAEESAGLDEPAGRAAPGEALTQLDGGRPQEVLEVWLAAVETALAEAASPDLEGLLFDDDSTRSRKPNSSTGRWAICTSSARWRRTRPARYRSPCWPPPWSCRTRWRNRRTPSSKRSPR